MNYTETEKLQKINDLAYSIINDKLSKSDIRHNAAIICGIANGTIVGEEKDIYLSTTRDFRKLIGKIGIVK